MLLCECSEPVPQLALWSITGGKIGTFGELISVFILNRLA